MDFSHNLLLHRLLRLASAGEHMLNRPALRRHWAHSKSRRDTSTWWDGDPLWYPGGTPPRRHNRVIALIHGDSYFAALQQALERAESYIYIVGWCLTPNIPMARSSEVAHLRTQLLPLLSEAARRVPVRILLWSGAPALMQPTERSVRQVQRTIEQEGQGDIICCLDHTARLTHCHHQKAVVIDGQVAFVGGMDLTTFSGDRWDTASHLLRAGVNWHDVQLQIEGEAVADVEHNFRHRWEAVTGDANLPHREPRVEPGWNTPVQIIRTIPRRVYPFAPDGEFGIQYAYLHALRRARRLVYLENQYLWSPYVMAALREAIRRPRHEAFRIVVVLPAHAGNGRWDNDKHVEQLRKADAGRGIVSVYAPYTSGPNMGVRPFSYRSVYVHAKVAVIDDEWLTVGSANLNDRGLVTDSELNALVHDPELARGVRLDLWSEHLGLPREQLAGADSIDLVDHEWKLTAEENAAIIAMGRRPLVGTACRYKVARELGDLLLEDVQSLTFEH